MVEVIPVMCVLCSRDCSAAQQWQWRRWFGLVDHWPLARLPPAYTGEKNCSSCCSGFTGQTAWSTSTYWNTFFSECAKTSVHVSVSVAVCVCVWDHQAARLLFVLRHKWLQLFFKRMSSPSKFSSPQDEAVVHCLVSVRRTQPLCMLSHLNTNTLLEKMGGCELNWAAALSPAGPWSGGDGSRSTAASRGWTATSANALQRGPAHLHQDL